MPIVTVDDVKALAADRLDHSIGRHRLTKKRKPRGAVDVLRSLILVQHGMTKKQKRNVRIPQPGNEHKHELAPAIPGDRERSNTLKPPFVLISGCPAATESVWANPRIKRQGNLDIHAEPFERRGQGITHIPQAPEFIDGGHFTGDK